MGNKFLKDISLDRRNEEREIVQNIIADIDSEKIKRQLDDNIENIKSKFDIYDKLVAENLKNEADDVLRSQIVFLMSALDFYMHEIVKYSLIKIFKREKEKTSSYKNFIVSIEVVEKALDNPENIDWLSEEIILRHSKNTYMGSKKIKEALSLISTEKVFSKVADNLNYQTKDLSNKIDEIYKRRNKIAHQSDRDPESTELNLITK